MKYKEKGNGSRNSCYIIGGEQIWNNLGEKCSLPPGKKPADKTFWQTHTPTHTHVFKERCGG